MQPTHPETTIYFVRHGEVYNPHEVFYGRLPYFGLSARGRLQAQAAADYLKEQQAKQVQAVFSSPLLRARQTARTIAQALDGLKVLTRADLSEVYTPFDGQTIQVLEARGWDIYTGVSAPYEQPEDVVRRVRRFIAQIRVRYAGQAVVAVTHADVVLNLAVWARGLPVGPESKARWKEFGFAEKLSFSGFDPGVYLAER